MHTHTLPSEHLHALKIHIQEGCESVDTRVLSNAWNEIVILMCVITKEAHAEIR
jgi:hypothetical protein